MQKKKILILCPFPQDVAAGQRLKYEQYLDNWRNNGYEVVVSSFMDKKMWDIVYLQGNLVGKILGTILGYFRRLYDLFRISQFDIVYVFMWVTPLGSSFVERLTRRMSNYLIYDIEDNIMHKNPHSPGTNSIVNYLRGSGKILYLIKQADHVITSSPVLNNYCITVNQKKSCIYISSSVDTDNFIPSNNYNNDKKVVIGWTGTFSSKEYLDNLRDVLVKLNRICDFKLRVIGDFDYELPGVDLEVIRWTRENEVKDLQGIDSGIYPLIEDEWVSGKSGLKAIQYMAFGLPTVATNVGNTPSIIEHMENGWLVKSNEDWMYALDRLIKTPALRKKLGISARKKVLENYSKHVIQDQYLLILNRLE